MPRGRRAEEMRQVTRDRVANSASALPTRRRCPPRRALPGAYRPEAGGEWPNFAPTAAHTFSGAVVEADNAAQGHPMTQRHLAKLLEGFGIKAKQIRQGADTRRGHLRSDFTDAFRRYLPRPKHRNIVMPLLS
jgi:uncharacterized protein DUF3631